MRLLSISFLAVLMPLSPLYARKFPKLRLKTHHGKRWVQYGVASWYGNEDQGRPMACGETFNVHELVAAHRSLPLGTKVRVTNLRNGRSVVVSILDRGPAVTGRVIDVSMAAAERLGFMQRGLTPVKIQVLGRPTTDQQTIQAALHRPFRAWN
jgi:rare lipoprotein A